MEFSFKSLKQVILYFILIPFCVWVIWVEVPISLNLDNNTANFHYTEKPSAFCKYVIRFHLLIGCVQKEEQILKKHANKSKCSHFAKHFWHRSCALIALYPHVLSCYQAFHNGNVIFEAHFNCVISAWLNFFLSPLLSRLLML